MNLAEENMLSNDLPEKPSPLDSLLQALLYQLQTASTDIESLKEIITQIRNHLLTSAEEIKLRQVNVFFPYIQKSKGEVASQLFLFCESIADKFAKPWTFIKEMLLARDKNLVLNTLELFKNLVAKNFIQINHSIINFFAERLSVENDILNTQDSLIKIAHSFSQLRVKNDKKHSDPILELYLESKEFYIRLLTAKLLDARGTPATKEIIFILLGEEAAKSIISYLSYTRATYQDLLYISSMIGHQAPIVEAINNCKKTCSENIIRDVIAKLGWKYVNFGLSVKRYVGISLGGSLPVFLHEREAALLEKATTSEIVSDYYLFISHAGSPFDNNDNKQDNKPVALFRNYNLAHANLLQEILDVKPLTSGRVKRIVEQLDRIVENFILLFGHYTEECSVLPDVYAKIKNKVLYELERENADSHLSADLTRLVQMFEDPRSIGEVHTLHGLKRYLHQKGLQLGFKLVDQSKSPNQIISLALTSKNSVLSVIKKINFANFEPESASVSSFVKIPYPIKVVINGFERQLLFGHENFPSVNIFCYGNEVHYFVWFRNHPVFIRIDFSPPLQGGMIDLQYFGVSNYEIADHPNINLDAIKYFFKYLEFDVTAEGTHIQARYDKERALDLSQLCERIEYLFCLAPYLMDLDWIIGSLNLPSDAREKVTRAWAEYFACWGVLPFNKFLTNDKLGILQDVLTTTEGEYELVWSGEDEYQDQYSIPIPNNFFSRTFELFEDLGLSIQRFSLDKLNQAGQLFLEKKLFNYLREALTNGEIIETETGYIKAPEDLFRRIHEAQFFAEIISRGDEELESSVALAQVIIPLEQTFKFQNTGTLESFKVQSAILPLQGENLKLYVLRNNKGIIRLAFFIYGNQLFLKRINQNDPWKINAEISPAKLMKLLRFNNYNVTGSEPSVEFLKDEIQKVKEELLFRPKQILQIRTSDEKIAEGLRASPGRASGRVILGTVGRMPEDYIDHIFVSAAVSPDETTILFHSAGIVATGGGILSHAGLIATQFNKPAIIISGYWKKQPDNSLVLFYKTLDYKIDYQTSYGFNISVYYDMQEKEYSLQDGDLVVLDADDGTLKVLGQDRDTIGLYENFKLLGRTNQEISEVIDVNQLLMLRGKKLHIKHQLEKLIRRISNPVLAKYAIHEILIGNFLRENRSTPDEKASLLSLILNNKKVADLSKKYLLQTINEIENKFLNAYTKAKKYIPVAKYPFEVVMPRLDVLRIYDTLKSVASFLAANLSQSITLEGNNIYELNQISLISVREIRKNLLEKIKNLFGKTEEKEYLRHLFRQLGRVDLLLNSSEDEKASVNKIQVQFALEDAIARKNLGEKFILKPSEGALELVSMIGYKAANLAELEQIGSKGLIPPWFVITDKCFQSVLNTAIKEEFLVEGKDDSFQLSLREAIGKILSRNDIKNEEKSARIRSLWDKLSLPIEVKRQILEEYHKIEREFFAGLSDKLNKDKFYVALRSSSCEEDAEIAANAGEFETYLFINGETLLLEYLKKTWSGLWTERAIHNRAAFRDQQVQTKGGIIVQRIVWSRVSGVLQTINAAKGDLKEMVINAGLGLGEGVVSGKVAADQIIVSKEGDLQKGPLHFSYVTADKKEQVLFNKKAGFGTILTSTLYHQRFRPALEYVELCELVAVASRLEDAYGYPLDIEFAIEGTKLWILQVRPVATFLPALKETLEKYPLTNLNNKIAQERVK